MGTHRGRGLLLILFLVSAGAEEKGAGPHAFLFNASFVFTSTSARRKNLHTLAEASVDCRRFSVFAAANI